MIVAPEFVWRRSRPVFDTTRFLNRPELQGYAISSRAPHSRPTAETPVAPRYFRRRPMRSVRPLMLSAALSRHHPAKPTHRRALVSSASALAGLSAGLTAAATAAAQSQTDLDFGGDGSGIIIGQTLLGAVHSHQSGLTHSHNPLTHSPSVPTTRIVFQPRERHWSPAPSPLHLYLYSHPHPASCRLSLRWSLSPRPPPCPWPCLRRFRSPYQFRSQFRRQCRCLRRVSRS